MIDTDAAYLAGIVDGEGSIMAYSEHRHNRQYSSVIARLVISNTDKPLLVWLTYLLQDGRIEERKPHNRERTQYTLRLSGLRCAPAIRVMLPYLRIKQPQALLVLELIGLQSHSTGHAKYQPERQLEIERELRELNHKGVRATPTEHTEL